MNRIFAVFLCVFGFAFASAQIHEIGGFVGASNYIGDIGPTNFIRPKDFAFGFLYKWNRSPRHAWRISYMHTRLSDADADADSEARQQRGFSFSNDLQELSLGIEFNFFDFNLHDGKKKLTPYVYTGLSGFLYDETFFLDAEQRTDHRAASLAIPITVGLKTNIMDNWVLGVECGARWTFTDNLDGSNPKDNNLEPLRFGNINNKDWYVFTGVTLTYTFGNKPCYCVE